MFDLFNWSISNVNSCWVIKCQMLYEASSEDLTSIIIANQTKLTDPYPTSRSLN